MARRKTTDRDLSEFEKRLETQETRLTEIEKGVEKHLDAFKRLEESLQDLRGQMEGVASDDVRMAINEVAEAQGDVVRELEAAEEERNELLEENDEMQKQVQEAHKQRAASLQKLTLTVMAMPEGSAKGRASAASDSIQRDMNKLGLLDAQLKEVAGKLKALNVNPR